MHLGSRHGLNGYSWMLMYNSLTIQAASFRTPVVPHKSRIIQEVRREKGKLCTMILGQWDRRTCKLPQAPVRHRYFIEAHQISTRSSAATAARSGWAPQGTEPRNDHYREKPSPGPGRGRRAGLVRQLGLAGLFVLLPPAQHTMDTLVAYLKGHIATNGAAWGRALPVPCAGDPGTGEVQMSLRSWKSFWVSACGTQGLFSLHKAPVVAMRRKEAAREQLTPPSAWGCGSTAQWREGHRYTALIAGPLHRGRQKKN